jgi:hypothetical protein
VTATEARTFNSLQAALRLLGPEPGSAAHQRSGWLTCIRLSVSAFETEDHLLFAVVRDAAIDAEARMSACSIHSRATAPPQSGG